MCVAACPVGAIGKDGEFDGLACTMHNYREFMSGHRPGADRGRQPGRRRLPLPGHRF
ncbi:hypothetical protein [Trebonia kvetii]|uniref:hypothetical protein n=1 Tax=Trebonia kvetii TaxID=2480626 RepID=UPI001C9E2DDC